MAVFVTMETDWIPDPLLLKWLALLVHWMDVVGAIYRLVSSLSPESRALRSHSHVGRRLGVVRPGRLSYPSTT